MNEGRRDAPDFSEVIPLVRGALALTAVFFPRVTEDGKAYVRPADALFFLSGQMDKWSLWPQLPEADKELIAGLLRWRPVEVANRTVFGELLALLLPDRIPDFRALGDGTVLVETGRHPREVARDCAQQLWLEQQARPERPVPVANSGQFAAWVRGGAPGTRSARATYSLDVVPKTEPEAPIDLGPAARADTIEVPVADLAALAARADDAFGERHRSDSVHRVFSRIQAAAGATARSRVDPARRTHADAQRADRHREERRSGTAGLLGRRTRHGDDDARAEQRGRGAHCALDRGEHARARHRR